MKPKATATVLKIAGLATVGYRVLELPPFVLHGPHIASGFDLGVMVSQVGVALLVPTVCGLLLWFFPVSLLNNAGDGETRTEPGLAMFDLSRITLTVMGIWLAVYGLVDLIFTALFATAFYPEVVRRSELFNTYLPSAATDAAKIAVGVVLVFSANRVSNWLVARGEG